MSDVLTELARLIRSRRRTIGVEIAYGGAVVRAPHWVRVGDIPGYALMPRGEPCSTTVYYRDLTS